MRTKLLAVVGLVTAFVVGGAAAASAQTAPVPATEATNIITDGVAALGPVIVAVAAGGLSLLVLTIGIRMAYGVVKARGQRAV